MRARVARHFRAPSREYPARWPTATSARQHQSTLVTIAANVVQAHPTTVAQRHRAVTSRRLPSTALGALRRSTQGSDEPSGNESQLVRTDHVDTCAAHPTSGPTRARHKHSFGRCNR